MKKLFTLIFCSSAFSFLVLSTVTGQVAYTQQQSNYDLTSTSAGGDYNGTNELGMFMDGDNSGGGFAGTVKWKTLKDAATGGNARVLRIGDEFTITVSTRGVYYGTIGVSLNAGSLPSASWANRTSGRRLTIQQDGINFGNSGGRGSWYYTTGSTAEFGITPNSVRANYVIKFKLTAPNMANVTVNGTTLYDVALGGTTDATISNYAVFLSDDRSLAFNDNSGGRGDALWKQTTSVNNTGTIEIGSSNTTFSISNVIANGSAASNDGNPSINALIKSGTGTITLTAANTYTGTTTVSAGTLVLSNTSGAIASGNGVTVNGGTLRISENQTLASLTVSSGSVIVDDGKTLTIGTLTLTSGKITLGTGNVIANTISGGSASSYVATTGTGTLTINNVPASATLFPIGTSASANNYDPVTLTPASTGATFSARVKGSITNTLSPNMGNSALIVNREWDISRTGTASNTTLAFTPAASTIARNVDNSTTRPADGAAAVIGHWGGSSWDANIAATHNSGTWTTNAPYSGTFSPFIVADAAAVLSTELTDINVKAKGNTSLLTWQTASEKDNALFQIERSANATDFSPIGEVKGAGNSAAAKNYTFTDVAPLSGVNYYRLKAVDYNGAATFSKVVSVNFSSKNDGKMAIYPNPTRDVLRVDLNATEAATTLIQITDLMGRVVLSQSVTINKGANLLPFNVASLPSGAYFVKINGDVTRFVKQ